MEKRRGKYRNCLILAVLIEDVKQEHLQALQELNNAPKVNIKQITLYNSPLEYEYSNLTFKQKPSSSSHDTPIHHCVVDQDPKETLNKMREQFHSLIQQRLLKGFTKHDFFFGINKLHSPNKTISKGTKK